MDWNDIYQRNKKLDTHFEQKYLNKEPYYFEKNCLELTVEIGEFVNETKCFKYWTIKKPNKDDMLEECADVIMMLLYCYNHLKVPTIDVRSRECMDILKDINHIFYLSTTLMNEAKKVTIDDIFSYVLGIANKLGLKEKELIVSCNKKIDKVEERLNSDY